MKQVFNHKKLGFELADEIVDTIVNLTDKYMEGKFNTSEYKEANTTVNEQFMKYCVESIPGMSYSELNQIKNPMIHNNPFFKNAFATVLVQAITPAVPTVVANGYEDLYEVHQTGWGDNAKFFVESNELFIVNDIGEGIKRGGVQTAINTEYTISASPKQLATYVDWYLVAASKLDWGYICAKVGMSYAAYVQAKVAKVMANVVTNSASYGISGYIANGMTDQNWLVA